MLQSSSLSAPLYVPCTVGLHTFRQQKNSARWPTAHKSPSLQNPPTSPRRALIVFVHGQSSVSQNSLPGVVRDWGIPLGSFLRSSSRAEAASARKCLSYVSRDFSGARLEREEGGAGGPEQRFSTPERHRPFCILVGICGVSWYACIRS